MEEVKHLACTSCLGSYLDEFSQNYLVYLQVFCRLEGQSTDVQKLLLCFCLYMRMLGVKQDDGQIIVTLVTPLAHDGSGLATHTKGMTYHSWR